VQKSAFLNREGKAGSWKGVEIESTHTAALPYLFLVGRIVHEREGGAGIYPALRIGGHTLNGSAKLSSGAVANARTAKTKNRQLTEDSV
jgi:hypothetical protein